MAHYTTHLAFHIPMSARQGREAIQLFDDLDAAMYEISIDDDAEIQDAKIGDLARASRGVDSHGLKVNYDEREKSLFICDDNGFPEVEVLQGALTVLSQRLALDEPIEFEWSNTADRSVSGAFGGGAAVVTAQGSEEMTTRRWAREAVAEMRALMERSADAPTPPGG